MLFRSPVSLVQILLLVLVQTSKQLKTRLRVPYISRLYKQLQILLVIKNPPANSYDINERYEILKELYDTELFVRKAEFSSYHMELIRMVVNDSTANSEIKWLQILLVIKNPPNRFQNLSICIVFYCTLQCPVSHAVHKFSF